MICDRFEVHARGFEYRALREHRRERIHLVGVFERVPGTDVGQNTFRSIDADVIVQKASQLGQRPSQRVFALCEHTLRRATSVISNLW